ncbi:DUF1360 domain-containing protein [Paraliobacillus sp. PM-2]|uniref:DUF1360 domain-containing protein n=1 Tax=Paraliobacillus sp. PM-2 TaxID=1462524 RepID=UPI00210022F0|nr:DUF1360 domain-containing protein [Paraliobacillus sp. PM-2]
MFEFTLLGLAAFRCMRLFAFDLVSIKLRQYFQVEEEHFLEDGTVEVIISGKGKGIRYIIGEMLACHWCVGMWSTIGLYTGYTLAPMIFTPIIVVLAIAALAGIIEVFLSK